MTVGAINPRNLEVTTMGKAARVKATERALRFSRMQTIAHHDSKSAEAKRLVEIGGISLAGQVRGTARQKVKMLAGSPVHRSAVLRYGTRRQKRAAQRATSLIAKLEKLKTASA